MQKTEMVKSVLCLKYMILIANIQMRLLLSQKPESVSDGSLKCVHVMLEQRMYT